ncbi:MAG: hypothetical protein ABIQ16_03245 [Polyangiaceae bacterium]
MRSSAEAGGAADVGAAPPPWGSERLRFVGATPECAALAEDTAHRLEQVRDPFEPTSPDESAARVATFAALIRAHTACVPGDGGAWVTFFEGGTDPRAWAWFVGFLPQGGALAKHAGNFPDQVDARVNHAAYTGTGDLFDGSTYRGPYRLQVVSDYNGDGRPEAVVWTAQIGQEVRSSARGTLWTFESGHVAPYGKANKLAIAPFEVDVAVASEPAPLKDVDADGRVDLLTYGPFFGVFKQGCGVIESFDAFGPRLLQHSLPDGTFSDRDSVASSQAKRQCPAPPAHVLSFGEHGLDQPAAFTNLACARLWNVPASAIASERKAACGNTPPPPDTDCEAPRKCSSEALAVIAAWEKAQAPFTLK